MITTILMSISVLGLISLHYFSFKTIKLIKKTEQRKQSPLHTLTRKDIVAKVWEAKATGAKLVTVPRSCEIKKGDYVSIIRV